MSPKDYLSNKNYFALYLNTIGIKFASALVLSFVGTYLFLKGIPLPFIFLYFGAEFIIRALITPFSGVITSRYGFKHTIIAANIVLICYFIALSSIDTYPLIGYMSFILHAIARGLYYPTKHYIQAKFVQEFNRGRFLTLEMVIASLTGVAAALLATYSITTGNSFLPIALVASVFLIFSSLSILLLLGHLPREEGMTYEKIIKFKSSKVFRTDMQAFIGFSLNVVFNNVVVALLVFFTVKSFELFGIIMAAVFILEMLLTLLYGKIIDKNRMKSNKTASLLQIGSYVSFLFATTPLLVTIIKSFYNLIWNTFDSSFTVRFHSKINRKGLIYSCAKEISLGLASGLACCLLAAIAYFWANAVFIFALVIASLGVIIAWAQFKD